MRYENSPVTGICGAITAQRGRPCRWDRELCADDPSGNPRCYRHCKCAKHVKKRKETSRNAGRTTQAIARARRTWPLPGDPQSQDDIKVLIAWAMRSLEVNIATKVARLCDLWLKAHAQSELAKELRELRDLADRYKSSKPSK